MSRQRRHILPGIPHHVVQRASHQAFILADDADIAVLVRIMLRWQEGTAIQIAAFVIMGNHFHLVAVSPTEDALSEFMAGVCSEFSRYYNSKCGRRGPNWQGRFFAAPMDQLHTVAAIKYIERNPVVARMVENAWNWHWSSAGFHSGLGNEPSLLNCDLRPAGMSAAEWKEHLLQPTDSELRARLKRATNGNRAFGAPTWADAIDRRLGLRVRKKTGTGVPVTHGTHVTNVTNGVPLVTGT